MLSMVKFLPTSVSLLPLWARYLRPLNPARSHHTDRHPMPRVVVIALHIPRCVDGGRLPAPGVVDGAGHHGMGAWLQVHIGFPEDPAPRLSSRGDSRGEPSIPTIRRYLDGRERAAAGAHGPPTNPERARLQDLVRHRRHDDAVERRLAQCIAGGDVTRIARIGLALNPVRLALKIIAGGLCHEGDAAQPLDAPCPDPARHYGTQRKAVLHRQRCSVELGGQEGIAVERLGEVDGAAEPEALALALNLVEPDKFDVAGIPAGSRGGQDIAEGDAAPSPRTGRLRPPGQLTRQRAEGEEFVPAKPGAYQRGRDLSSGKRAGQLVERVSWPAGPPARPPRAATSRRRSGGTRRGSW